MCGRIYETYTEDEIRKRFEPTMKKYLIDEDLRPNYNGAPTQRAPVLFVHEKYGISMDLFRWGLIPFWAKDVKSASKYSLINARSEEITEKRTYKQAFEKRRCIVPVSGFYEWKRPEEGPKRPFAIHLKEEPIMAMAGIWEYWESKETDEKIYSFSILTTKSNSFMTKIHDRMPVILSRDKEEAWLDSSVTDPEKLKKFLKPSPSAWLEAHEVSPMVNSPKNNRPEILEKI